MKTPFPIQPVGPPDDNSKWVLPDSISNPEVKPLSADDSVGFTNVKVVIARVLNEKAAPNGCVFFCLIPGYALLEHGNHVTKTSGTFLYCAVFTQPEVEGRTPGIKLAISRSKSQQT